MQPATRSSNQPLGQTIGGTSGDWHHRLLHFHVPIAIVSFIVLFLWMSLPRTQISGHRRPPQVAIQTPSHQSPSHGGTPGADHQGTPQSGSGNPTMSHSGDQTINASGTQNRFLIARFTTATGYIALGLLGLTLLIGPANLLLHRRTPISSYLARDVGMWAALISVIHVIAGFFVHGQSYTLGERILFYFFAPDGNLLTNTFGMGNWTGLAATIIVVGLLTISSDAALRKLKAGPWKRLQRLNYALFALVLAHAIYYGALLRVTSPTTILLGLITILVFAGQAIGIWLWRRRHYRTEARSV